MPFRDAHEAVARAVRTASERSVSLSELPLEELRGFSNLIERDVTDVLTLEGSVDSRDHFGGTAPNQVRASVRRHRERLQGAS
jgi:argininosuccinate lyase